MPVQSAVKPAADNAVKVRPVQPDDNAALAAIIRNVLTEFGCTAEGFAIHDPEIDHVYETYVHHDSRSVYFVAQADGKIVGGGGIAPLRGTYQNICELQKFYILPEYRGRGLGKRILELCLQFACEQHYQRCYIETVGKMDAAESLYRKAGFEPIDMPLGNTGHYACDRWYMKVLMHG